MRSRSSGNRADDLSFHGIRKAEAVWWNLTTSALIEQSLRRREGHLAVTGVLMHAGYLGGVDIFNMAGLLDSLMAFDFAKAVIDNEIALMLKQIKRGFEFSRENFALDQIAEVGPGGMFAGTEHTLERMRTA